MRWLLLAFGILANAFGSFLMKMAVLPPRRLPTLQDPWTALTNWPLWLGIVLYGSGLVAFVAALNRLPLNVAHPLLASGAIALVPFLSVIFLREPFYWTTALGLGLIIAGVLLITAHVQ